MSNFQLEPDNLNILTTAKINKPVVVLKRSLTGASADDVSMISAASTPKIAKQNGISKKGSFKR